MGRPHSVECGRDTFVLLASSPFKSEVVALFIGPVFTREVVTSPRRTRFYLYRVVYVGALLVLMCTAWLIVAGVQVIRNVGDMARFGSVLFQVMAPLQLALVVFFSALLAASAVALEKDRKTLILLLMSRLTNSELVLGRLMASLLNVLVMIAAGLPVFMLIVLFGGVSFGQVGRVLLVTLVTALAAGSLGSTLALWREKTFQTLAMTALAIVLWLGVWEAVARSEVLWRGVSAEVWAAGFSPFRAILAAARPAIAAQAPLGWLGDGANLFLLVGVLGTVLLNAVAIWRVRVWNPSREVRAHQRQEAEGATIWGPEHYVRRTSTEGAPAAEDRDQAAETARAGHVDSQLRAGRGGRSIERCGTTPCCGGRCGLGPTVRRFSSSMSGTSSCSPWRRPGCGGTMQQAESLAPRDEAGTELPLSARLMTPLLVVSVAIVNALAVTAITNERDGRSLDLLLATDLSAREFVLGKLGGVFWVTKPMVVLPVLLCVYLWWSGGVELENLVYLLGGLAVMFVFAAMLGIHCGMIYASSRTAISVSLGTVFFLFLGVVTCILMMISFSGSFQVQLQPFLAFVGGGAVGLFLALGARNPSAAIATASIIAPFATFFAITSYLLGNRELTVFLVTAGAYGFATAAMLVPAIGEFDIAMGRTQGQEE
jgi:ABC-type transport system involved in multi-copper enzyme maturation permease subunit